MKKCLFTVISFLLAYNFFRPNIFASDNSLILESSQEPSIYSGHHSHCSHASHASHYSYYGENVSSGGRHKSPQIVVVNHDSIESVTFDAKFEDSDSLKSIVKAYIAEVQLTDSTKVHFNGKAMIIAVKEDYGNYERSPRIKVTTHIVPLDSYENRYFTTNGHLGYKDLSSMYSTLHSDLLNQFKKDWLVRDKKPWMYAFDNNFFNNILDLLN